MKKLIPISTIILLIVAVIIIACNKKEKPFSPTSTNAAQSNVVAGGSQSNDITGNDGDEETMKKNLQIIALGLLDLSKDRAFINQINAEAAKERDGDFDVIIIPPSPPESENRPPLCWDNREGGGIFTPDVINKMKKSITNNGGTQEDAGRVNKILFTFKINGQNVFPQIFIPFFDEVDLTKSPMIGLNFGDGSMILDGWKFENGSLQQTQISEDMAKGTPVWVVGMNERVCDDGDFPPPQAMYENPYVCGNCHCEPSIGENNSTCPSDCPPSATLCGNGICGAGETQCNCSTDCFGEVGKGAGCTGYKLTIQFKKIGVTSGARKDEWPDGDDEVYCKIVRYEPSSIDCDVNVVSNATALKTIKHRKKKDERGQLLDVDGTVYVETDWDINDIRNHTSFIIYDQDHITNTNNYSAYCYYGNYCCDVYKGRDAAYYHGDIVWTDQNCGDISGSGGEAMWVWNWSLE